MKRLHLLLAMPVCLASPCWAQAFTSPLGFDVQEGNASQTVLFGAVDRRFQQIDGSATALGARSISSIAFRREGDLASATSGPRTMDMTIVMGHGDVNAYGAEFDANYTSTPVTVFATQQVSMPDWTGLETGPAPFDFVVTFDTPFAYNGADALVWEIIVENASVGSTVYLDRQNSSTPFGFVEGNIVSPGCVHTTQTNSFELEVAAFNYGSTGSLGQRLVFWGSYCGAEEPIALDIGVNTPPSGAPFLCEPFLGVLFVSIGIGNAGPTGFIPEFTIDVPYDPLLEGANLATQAISLDASQPAPFLPFIFSDVREFTMPTSVAPLECHYVYAAGGASTMGTPFPNRGVIVRFD